MRLGVIKPLDDFARQRVVSEGGKHTSLFPAFFLGLGEGAPIGAEIGNGKKDRRAFFFAGFGLCRGRCKTGKTCKGGKKKAQSHPAGGEKGRNGKVRHLRQNRAYPSKEGVENGRIPTMAL